MEYGSKKAKRQKPLNMFTAIIRSVLVMKDRVELSNIFSLMLKMDAGLKDNRGFRGYKTVQDMEDRFAKEDAKEIELILGEN